MNKQTAVEYLHQKFAMYLSFHEGDHRAKEYTIQDFVKDFQEAKQMEKQEQDFISAQRYMDGYNKAKDNFYQREISVEEIEQAASKATYNDKLDWENQHALVAFIKGIEWYKQQLKHK